MNSGMFGWFRTTMVRAVVDCVCHAALGSLSTSDWCRASPWCHAVVDGSRPRTKPFPLPLHRAQVAADVSGTVHHAYLLVTFRALLAFVSF